MYQDNLKKEWINPKVKDILLVLGAASFISAILLFPNLPMALKPVMDYKRKKEYQDQRKLWKKYNPYQLRKILKRLMEQKDVQFVTKDGEEVIKLTEKGRIKHLKYDLDEMSIKDKRWDGRWRLVIYDVPHFKKTEREIFRRFIKRMELFQLQESVYLTPYKCEDEVKYLREYFGLSKEVMILTIDKLENDLAYKQYFGL